VIIGKVEYQKASLYRELKYSPISEQLSAIMIENKDYLGFIIVPWQRWPINP
jgi:hypothetical protein